MTAFTCANAKCQADLGEDYVALITTTHVYRFCSAECIAEGRQARHARPGRRRSAARPHRLPDRRGLETMDDFLRDQLSHYWAEAGARLGFWDAPQPAPPAPAEPPPPQPVPRKRPGTIPAGARGTAAGSDFLRATLRSFRR